MITCVVKLEFDAGHRVAGHEHKCKYLHGHRYKLELSAASKALDSLGRVVDFGVLKSIAKEWIDTHLDHTTILKKSDLELGSYIEKYTGQTVYYLENNPTAENIALHLKNEIFPILFKNHKEFQITMVKLHETPNCHTIVT